MESELLEAVRRLSIGTIKQCIQKGVDVNQKANDGWTALHFAVYYGNQEMVKCLTEGKADVNQKNNTDQSSYDLFLQRFFMTRNAPQILKLLVNSGADPNTKRPSDGLGAVHLAIWLENTDLIKFLVDKGVTINPKDTPGWAPIRTEKAPAKD